MLSLLRLCSLKVASLNLPVHEIPKTLHGELEKMRLFNGTYTRQLGSGEDAQRSFMNLNYLGEAMWEIQVLNNLGVCNPFQCASECCGKSTRRTKFCLKEELEETLGFEICSALAVFGCANAQDWLYMEPNVNAKTTLRVEFDELEPFKGKISIETKSSVFFGPASYTHSFEIKSETFKYERSISHQFRQVLTNLDVNPMLLPFIMLPGFAHMWIPMFGRTRSVLLKEYTDSVDRELLILEEETCCKNNTA